MRILVLDVTADVRRFENACSSTIGQRLAAAGHQVDLFQLGSTSELLEGDFLARVNAVPCEFSVVLAHGTAQAPMATIALGESTFAELNNPYAFQSLFPAVAMRHKLFIVSEGLTAQAGAALNTGLPNQPVPPDTALVASLDSVKEDEAQEFTGAFFREYGKRSDVDAAVKAGRLSVRDAVEFHRWYWIPSVAVEEG